MTNKEKKKAYRDAQIAKLAAVDLSESYRFYESLTKKEIVENLIHTATYINTQQVILRQLQNENSQQTNELIVLESLYHNSIQECRQAKTAQARSDKEMLETAIENKKLKEEINQLKQQKVEMLKAFQAGRSKVTNHCDVDGGIAMSNIYYKMQDAGEVEWIYDIYT